MRDQQFGLFAESSDGLRRWRGLFTDLENAKSKAQDLADREGLKFVVLSFDGFWEVARCSPRPKLSGPESSGGRAPLATPPSTEPE